MSAGARGGGRKAEAGTGAGDAASIERHHRIPRRLLAAHDRMTRGTEIDAEALQAWFDFEEMCFEHGLDPDASREELEAAVEASAVLIPYEEHREVVHGADWPRWGRKGGLVTLARYGRSYYRLLALRRHGKVTPAELRAARTLPRSQATPCQRKPVRSVIFQPKGGRRAPEVPAYGGFAPFYKEEGPC